MRRLTASLIGFHEKSGKLGADHRAEPARRRDRGGGTRIVRHAARPWCRCCIRRAGSRRSGLRSPRSTMICATCWPPRSCCPTSLRASPDPRVQRFAPKLMRSLEARHRLLPVDAVLRPRPGGHARPAHDPGRERGSPRYANPPALPPTLPSPGSARSSAGLAIDADPDQLFRVLLNLVRNAAQALESRTEDHSSAPADPHHRAPARETVAIIEVSDTGPGHARKKTREHLFEAFQTSGRPGGSGTRACDRRRVGPRPWRRHPSGRRHHRRHLPDRHPRPPGGTALDPQRGGARA